MTASEQQQVYEYIKKIRWPAGQIIDSRFVLSAYFCSETQGNTKKTGQVALIKNFAQSNIRHLNRFDLGSHLAK